METVLPVRIITDHNNLKYFMTTKALNRRQVRWAQFLQDFNLTLEHRPGRLNTVADALSRRVQDELDIGDRMNQNACLLNPSLFATIAKYEDNPQLPHKQLEEAIIEANKTDTYYNSVIEWMTSEMDKRPPYPPNSGNLSSRQFDPDSGDGTDNGFYLYETGLLFYDDKLYIPASVRLTVMTSRHDSCVAGHLGVRKTLDLIQRDYWWPGMAKLIKTYVIECTACQRTKSSRRKYNGLLHPLPIPTERWKMVTIDFMTQLPLCDNYDSIMVVVDRHTKMAHFMPCRTDITSEQTAYLYIDRVFRYHGIPKTLVSDRGTQFVAQVWKTFCTQLGIEHHMSTGFHPETDGQTERVNQYINQYLRVYSSYQQDNWVSLLPCAEFSYNNSIHTATGVTPFFANAGIHPQGVGSISKGLSDDPNTLASYMSEISEFLSVNLTAAAEDMKRFADKHRTEAPKYNPGDKVLISTKNITTPRPKAKWSDKWIGPYKIIKEAHPNSDAYVLDLPSSVKMHPVFHTSLLLPYKDSSIPERIQPPPPPVIIDGEQEDEIETILDCQIRNNRIKYYVRWKGYGPKYDSWMDEDHMDNASDLVEEYHSKYPKPTRKSKPPKKKTKR
jgi:transposase InsO family protein